MREASSSSVRLRSGRRPDAAGPVPGGRHDLRPNVHRLVTAIPLRQQDCRSGRSQRELVEIGASATEKQLANALLGVEREAKHLFGD